MREPKVTIPVPDEFRQLPQSVRDPLLVDALEEVCQPEPRPLYEGIYVIDNVHDVRRRHFGDEPPTRELVEFVLHHLNIQREQLEQAATSGRGDLACLFFQSLDDDESVSNAGLLAIAGELAAAVARRVEGEHQRTSGRSR